MDDSLKGGTVDSAGVGEVRAANEFDKDMVVGKEDLHSRPVPY
jgi:hypothetical protein